jgi:hypothetical protein
MWLALGSDASLVVKVVMVRVVTLSKNLEESQAGNSKSCYSIFLVTL